MDEKLKAFSLVLRGPIGLMQLKPPSEPRFIVIEKVDFAHDVRLMHQRRGEEITFGKIRAAECGIAGQFAFQAYLNENRIYYLGDTPEFFWKLNILENNVDFDVLGVGLVEVKTFRSYHENFELNVDKVKSDDKMPDYFVVLKEKEQDEFLGMLKSRRMFESLEKSKIDLLKSEGFRCFETVGWLLGSEVQTFPIIKRETSINDKTKMRKPRYQWPFENIRKYRSFDVLHEKLLKSKDYYTDAKNYAQMMRNDLEAHMRDILKPPR